MLPLTIPACEHPELLDRFQPVQGVLRVINKAHRLFLFSHQEKKAIKRNQQRLLAYQQALKPSSHPAESPIVFSEPDQTEGIIQQKLNYYAWLKKESQLLNEDRVWQAMSHHCVTPVGLSVLRQQWQRHAKFARWGHAAIKHVAFDLLPPLFHYQRHELAWCAKRRTAWPSAVANAHQEALNVFSQQTRALSEGLRESIYARLLAFDSSEGEYSDVVSHVIGSLQTMDALPQNMRLPIYKDVITNEQFTAFQWYITQSKQPDLITRFHALSWQWEHCFLTNVLQSQAQRVLLVPKSLAHFVPTKKRWPMKLFKGHYFRWEFFANKASLLAVLSSCLTPHHLVTTSLSIDASLNWQRWMRVYDLIIQTQQERWPDIPSLFRRRSQHLISAWQQWLATCQDKVIENLLECLENKVRQLRTTYQESLSIAMVAWPDCNAVQSGLQKLQAAIQYIPSMGKFSARLERIEQENADMWVFHQAYVLVSKMADGHLVAPAQLDYLFDYYAVTLEQMPQHAERFLQVIEPQLNVIFYRIQEELSRSIYKMNSHAVLKQHSDRLLCLNAVICRFGTEKQNSKIAARVALYFSEYLHNMVSNGIVGHEEQLCCAETMLQLLGQSLPFLGGSIATWAHELATLRRTKQFDLLMVKSKQLLTLTVQHILQNKLSKDISTLDTSIAQFVKNNPKLNYSESTVATLFSIRNQMVAHQTSAVEKVKHALSKSEQVLVGINCPQTKQVGLLLKMSSKAHQLKQQLSLNTMSFFEKQNKLKKFHESLAHLLQQDVQVQQALELVNTRLIKRQIFMRNYSVR